MADVCGDEGSAVGLVVVGGDEGSAVGLAVIGDDEGFAVARSRAHCLGNLCWCPVIVVHAYPSP